MRLGKEYLRRCWHHVVHLYTHTCWTAPDCFGMLQAASPGRWSSAKIDSLPPPKPCQLIPAHGLSPRIRQLTTPHVSGTGCSLIHTLWQATAHGLLPTPPAEGQLQNKGLAQGDERREGSWGCSSKINGRPGGVSCWIIQQLGPNT